jgi:hypothetical protein
VQLLGEIESAHRKGVTGKVIPQRWLPVRSAASPLAGHFRVSLAIVASLLFKSFDRGISREFCANPFHRRYGAGDQPRRYGGDLRPKASGCNRTWVASVE